MEDERVISFERGKQLADSLGFEFFETSAKENVNVRVRLEGRIQGKFGTFSYFYKATLLVICKQ
jgi:hypothetical protein